MDFKLERYYYVSSCRVCLRLSIASFFYFFNLVVEFGSISSPSSSSVSWVLILSYLSSRVCQSFVPSWKV